MAKFGPLAPMSIETLPEAMFGSIIGTKNGEMRFGPLVSRVSVPALEGLHAAHAGTDQDPDSLGFGWNIETRLRDRFPRRRDGELGVAIHAAAFLAANPFGRIEPLHLAGKSGFESLGIESGDWTDARSPGRDRIPRFPRAEFPTAQMPPIPVTTTRRLVSRSADAAMPAPMVHSGQDPDDPR